MVNNAITCIFSYVNSEVADVQEDKRQEPPIPHAPVDVAENEEKVDAAKAVETKIESPVKVNYRPWYIFLFLHFR